MEDGKWSPTERGNFGIVHDDAVADPKSDILTGS